MSRSLKSNPLATTSWLAFIVALSCSHALADEGMWLPSIFGSNMVLQQKQENRVWGRSQPGSEVTVTIGDQTKVSKADTEGRWEVRLDPLDAGGPHTMTIKGEETITYENVLVGEVWICSGQSNMAWPVRAANDPDLESMSANFPKIRLISVPQVGTDEPQADFRGSWQECSPETVIDFSAVGYFFGRQLHQTLDVPIGLIDNAWGGSAAEAWVNRDRIDADETLAPLVKHWREIEERHKSGAEEAAYQERLAKWEADAAAARDAGKPAPRKPRRNNPMAGNQRPANIYNGVLHPTIGYGIRGVIWYQGESNASRAYQYRYLFPFMIQNWRDEWGQGDFPFYYVQLADFRQEKSEPAESDWAELREAQTMTMSRLPNTGEAVILNLGEAADIHPKNKQDVAKRLARWALAKDYGFESLVYRSPLYKSMEVKDNEIIVSFDHTGGGLDTFDVRELIGFTIAGEDRVFHPANATIIGRGKDAKQIRVSSDTVAHPVAVRYAWADNPICNVQNAEGLPLTPFRTDDWPGVTADRTHR